MGYEQDRFHSPVDADFLCKLCGKVLEEPLSTPCGHVFCAGCVKPWVAKWSSCPVKCRRLSTGELNRVLALKNLVLKLSVKCYNYPRCKAVLKLQHLSQHADTCQFSTVRPHTQHSVRDEPSALELRERMREKPVKHSYIHTERDESITHGRDVRSAEESTEKLLQLHREFNTTALEKFEHQTRTDELFSSFNPLYKGDETRKLALIHRSSGSLGFNIIGGRICEEYEISGDLSGGIYVSKIVTNGPADRGGLQIHDRIIKVNGKDLFLATHDEAVETFLKARDPIEIEVLRRIAPTKTSGILPSGARGLETSTQTDITQEHIQAMSNFDSNTTPLGVAMMDNCLPGGSKVAGYESFYPRGFFEDMPKDPGRELEYEEVELKRMNTKVKLGLTLCYKTDDEEETGIYVSEIDPKSIAAKNGRVREGDRIIQINGVEIQNHEEALTVLSQESSRNVHLLLARPEIQDDDWLEKDKPSFFDDLHMGMEEQHQQAIQFTASIFHQRGQEEDEMTTDTATVFSISHEKDSGVGRTDESTRNDESSEQENLGDDPTSISDTLSHTNKRLSQDSLGGRHMHLSSEPFLSGDGGDFTSIPEMDCERFRELLELKCLVNETSPFIILGDCDEQEIKMLNEELRNIELECLNIIRAHRLQKEIQRQQPSRNCRDQQSWNNTTPVEDQKKYSINTDLVKQNDKDKDSSSAYNTGESCHSSSFTLKLSSDITLSKGTHDGRSAIPHRHKPTTKSSNHTLSPIDETTAKNNQSIFREPGVTKQVNEKHQRNGHSEKNLLASPHFSPYKHIGNIPAHAQRYQSYMQLVQQKSAVECGQSEVSLVSLCRNPQSYSVDSKPKMEWKVKIRSDGTRYITKRPAREQLLRERALRIREERRGMTTDDDAASELKMGRYWSKDERKQHIIRAKEQRQRRESIKQNRLACANEPEGRTDEIIQLSHKKMMKKRNKKILDSWMTIQELLTHGAKSPDGTQLYNPLLSGTTV